MPSPERISNMVRPRKDNSEKVTTPEFLYRDHQNFPRLCLYATDSSDRAVVPPTGGLTRGWSHGRRPCRAAEGSGAVKPQLQEEDHRARGRNAELQAQLASYFNRKDPRDRDEDPEPDAQEYEECLKRLVHLRRQKSSRLESARRHEEKLRLREREQLKQVEDEWESVSTLKGKLAVSLLSGHFWAPEAARAKVEATLEDDRLARRELRTLRLKHAETEGRVGRLEALLRAEEGEQDKARDLLLLQFEQMLTQRTRRTKVDERGQEASGLRKNMKRTLELLSNMKEKLHWIQTEVQAKRDQLAQLEATLSAGRDLLARTRRARAGLRRDNAELRRRRGLLGDALLLRDFGVTAGAARRLQEELEKLKSWREERASAPSGQF